ncbi:MULTISPECIES: hypothetical protein [unclassified Nitrobacter]|mgnify:FL=1|uniref:hypothetical protein n=1 Tax=unclassified Nitrobacter TaxID=2620411 RepID=UPI001AC530C3|nr:MULTISPECIES: hypothetical protein [unclassified Nitrobacter]MBN9149713.1 hypothetical protein [Nitrobacter sp.]
MGAGVTLLVELAEQDRKSIASLPVLDERDEIELRVIRSNGEVQIVRLPPRAAGMIGALLYSLGHKKRVVLLSEGRAELISRQS